MGLNISYATHQCACFREATHGRYVNVIMHLSKYFIGTIEEVLLIKSDGIFF